MRQTQRQPISLTEPVHMKASICEHRQIISRLRGNDASRARREIKMHVTNTARCADLDLSVSRPTIGTQIGNHRNPVDCSAFWYHRSTRLGDAGYRYTHRHLSNATVAVEFNGEGRKLIYVVLTSHERRRAYTSRTRFHPCKGRYFRRRRRDIEKVH
jgi:hypothetical protein